MGRSLLYLAVWIGAEFLFWRLSGIFTLGLAGFLVTMGVAALLTRLGLEHRYDPKTDGPIGSARESYDWGDSDGDE